MLVGCCNNNKVIKDELPPADSVLSDETALVEKDKQWQIEPFKPIINYPTIRDTSTFISELKKNCKLEVDESPKSKEIEKISFYKKVKLFGSDKDFIFLEYDWGVGCMAIFPWKYQLLFTTDGKLIKALSGQRFDFIEIFPNQNPFLLAVIETAKGNGGHEIYKISADTLENVYEGYYDYAVQTVAGGESLYAFEPKELNIHFSDFNKDGVNDIIFTGVKLMLGKYTKDGFWYDVEVVKGKENHFSVNNPAKKIPIKYVFLYDRQSGHFKAKENYTDNN